MKGKCCAKKYFLLVVVVTLFMGLLYFCIGTSKSKGGEYDTNQVNEEEIMQVGETVDVYEGIGTSYNKITTLEQNSVIKRVESGVGEADGHTWDKVILSNGKEGYVFSDNLEMTVEGEYSKNTFEYEGVTYDVYLPTKVYNINIEDYPYYVIGESNEKSYMTIYYGTERFKCNESNGNYRVCNPKAIFVVVVWKNGKVSMNGKLVLDRDIQTVMIKENSSVITCKFANQDILLGNTKEKIFSKNCGYEYDANNEDGKNCNEIVKVNKKTIVYEKPALNYNEMMALEEKDIVKRTNHKINEKNGHVWDKIVLCNGKEGYVFSDNLEIVTKEEYENITFKHSIYGISTKMYNVYFPTLSYGINMKDYLYYIATVDNNYNMRICYSVTKFNVAESGEDYRLNNPSNVLMVTIKYKRKIEMQKNVVLGNTILIKKDKFQNNCITTNQEIYCGKNKILGQCIYDNKGICYKTDIGWNDIATTQSNYENIKRAEEMYNSMKPGDIAILYPTLLSQKAIILEGARGLQAIYPNAGSALEYFLTQKESGKTSLSVKDEGGIYKEGHTRRNIILINAMGESKSMEKKLNENIKNAIKVSEELNIVENTPITFCNVIEDSGEATEETSKDWFLTLHLYRIKMEYIVTRIKDDYQMKVRYEIDDYYDWDPQTDKDYSTLFQGNVLGNIADILPEYLYVMHNAGFARNYTNYGWIKCKVIWNKNDMKVTGKYEIENI